MINLISHHSREYRNLTKLNLLGGALLIGMLSACGGSGAGDSTELPTNTAGMAVEPLAGVWDLPDDWNGEDNDEAYLVIRLPDNTGVATAIVYDFDDISTGLGQSCFFVDSEGSVSPSLGNEVFMDISPFPDAIVSLSPAGDLVIEYTVGASISTDRETTTITATPLGFGETDVTPLC